MLFRLLPAVLLVAACAKKREPAPTEMVDIVEFMFTHWEDDLALGEAMDNLGPWLDDNVASEQSEKGFRLEPIPKADIDVTFPDRSFEGLLGAAGGAVSDFPLEDHAGHMPLRDQLFSNPTNYKAYVREMLDGDEGTFTGDALGLLRTTNAIETSNFGVSIPYELLKDYKWVETEESRAIIARSWVEDRACGNSGSNCLELSFSVDMFVEDGNKTQRFTASWSEVTSPLPLGDDALIAGLALGLQNVFYHTDEFLAGEQE